MTYHLDRADVLRHPELDENDVKILQLIAGGSTNQEIAAEFHVSTATVGRRLTMLFEKLGARDRTHAAILALVATVIEVSEVTLPTWVQVELNVTRERISNGE